MNVFCDDVRSCFSPNSVQFTVNDKNMVSPRSVSCPQFVKIKLSTCENASKTSNFAKFPNPAPETLNLSGILKTHENPENMFHYICSFSELLECRIEPSKM